jgi:uncharacterized protein (DUF2249 family)
MNSSIFEIGLDVRGLHPPEPLERVLHALSTLEPDQPLRMVIDREPFPLYEILVQKGFEYRAETIAPNHHEVRIWRKP